MAIKKDRPLVLIILDGWGQRQPAKDNAIALAHTPVWDQLWQQLPHTLIRTSGAAVGLPGDQMGNSEVGHLNLGAGRVVYQEFTRVSRAIRSRFFFTNRTLTDTVDQAIAAKKAVHILGLLSPGGVHSHEEHLQAMIQLAAERGADQIYLHAFLDGRDTAPKSAETSLQTTQSVFDSIGRGRIASVIGRYYAMDRDHRWPRIQQCYDLITQAKAEFRAENPLQALEMAYERGESDEFVQATAIVPAGEQPAYIADGDVVIFMNFRSDRARQITRALIENEFSGFERQVVPHLGRFVSLTEYHRDFQIPVAFPPEPLNNGFGEYLSRLGLRQLRLAETEKYAHVTFFFNGGKEEPFEGEDRILIPSPQVKTYDLQPEMSAAAVTDALIDAIAAKKHDAIICNYANPDMVGHSGHLAATIQAIEALDRCLGQVIEALDRFGGELLITADHGNAEQMCDPKTGQPHTAHTSNLVPLIYRGRPAELKSNGALCDIAPTMLALMGIKMPIEMTGRSLVQHQQGLVTIQ